MRDFDLFIGPLPESWYSEIDQYGHQPWRCTWCGILPTFKITSGTPECGWCWNWRKLDGPAAKHWYAVGRHFVSNIDMYDWMDFFPKAGLTNEEAATMIKAANKLVQYCETQIKEHGHGDSEEDWARLLMGLTADRCQEFARALRERSKA